jgi:hypothetical protein
MAIAIRGTIDVATGRLRYDPRFDIDGYTKQIADVFGQATRVDD